MMNEDLIPTVAETGSNSDRVVLPDNVVPRHYNVTLEPDFKNSISKGKVIIDLDVKRDCNSISLNTTDIDIHTTAVHVNGVLIESDPVLAYDTSAQVTTITLNKPIHTGQKVQLTHVYTALLDNSMVGLYQTHTESGGLIAVSQFEATYARRALPCFDEPALKAEFTVTLIVDEDMVCLSNMDVASSDTANSDVTGHKRKSVTFNRSPQMSTYLLAFVIGNFRAVTSDKARLPIKIWLTPDQVDSDAEFALEVAGKALDFYEKTFQIPYPLPKLDLVAIPDFAPGAMENWGLINFRVVDLLLDPHTTSAGIKERVAQVIQHELAHQWFGNLVTMEFWDGLWLNEGFATWMALYSCDILYPTWKVWETFVSTTLQSALELDSMKSSHPVEIPLRRAEDVAQVFDGISYNKGCAILRMISQYIGEDVFLSGVRYYLKKHAWGNARTVDLWHALSQASGKDIARIMNVWTTKVGYPILQVTENGDTITVEQHRFLQNGDVLPEDDLTLFPVMLGLGLEDAVSSDILLTERRQTFNIPTGLRFLKLNIGHVSLFRAKYSPARLVRLGKEVREGRLDVDDRAGLVADCGSLVASGHMKTSEFLRYLQNFRQEEQYVVWSSIINRLSTLSETWLFEGRSVRDNITAYQRNLVSQRAHTLGWELDVDESSNGENHVRSRLQALLFGSAGLAGDEIVCVAAKELFARYAAGDFKSVHPDLRQSILFIGIISGGEKEWNIVRERSFNAPTAEERDMCLKALGMTRQAELVEKTLALALSQDIRIQDILKPLEGLGESPEGAMRRFEWMCDSWDLLVQKLPLHTNMLGPLVKACAGVFTTPTQLGKVGKFFQGKDISGIERSVDQSIDTIRSKINWLTRDREDVQQFWIV